MRAERAKRLAGAGLAVLLSTSLGNVPPAVAVEPSCGVLKHDVAAMTAAGRNRRETREIRQAERRARREAQRRERSAGRHDGAH